MTIYLAAFFAALSVVVGALALLMIAVLSGATWLAPMRGYVERIASAAAAFPILYVPIALSLRSLYPWARPWAALAPRARASLEHAHVWFTPSFFLARAYAYLLVWAAFALALRGATPARLRVLSAAGLPLLLLTITFAGFDWLMSLEPGWTSDAFGLYLGAGGFAGALGAVAVSAWYGARDRPAMHPDSVHALGKVLLVAVLVWAYVGFCQFLLVWIADLPGEVGFYDDRRLGAWKWISAALVLAHFAAPFLLLLSRPLKRRLGALACVGALVLVAHAIDVTWLVLPSAHGGATGGRP